MEIINGDFVKEGPPPPSPLTGCYLLIVVAEPHSDDHKDIILQRIAKGLLSWDANNCLVDLEKELELMSEQALDGEEARHGERLIQFASENLVTEILIHPIVSTLVQCMRNLLSSFTRHRHIIHAGYTFAGNGSWALQDGTYSYADLSEAFLEIEAQRVIHAYENGISLDLHCSPEGDWCKLPKESFAKGCSVRVNPTDVLTCGSPSITRYINYVSQFLIPSPLENLLQCSDVVGNIRFSRPTLYVFPGGQGDAALFGVNGFNMLLDGGFSRKACFWDFVRHLDRLDAVLMTRLNNNNIGGISSVLRRKRKEAVYPQIGHFFCNIQDRKAALSPDGDKDKDPLLIDLLNEGQEIISNLRHLNLSPQTCYRDSDPINLYHKVGHGTLNMYVLNPAKDSKEVKEFLQKWNQSDQKLFNKQQKEFSFPIQNLVSITVLLIWQPANISDTVTRILYTGSSPQQKIFEGLESVKNMEFIKHPVCSEKTLYSKFILKKTAKSSATEKIISKEKPNERREKVITDNNITKAGSEAKEKIVKKSDSIEGERTKSKKIEENKTVIENDEKLRAKTKKIQAKGEPQQRMRFGEKKDSPTTPKKTMEQEVLKKPVAGTPAKSTKDANNRKVIENKTKSFKTSEPKTKLEKKPISRKPKSLTKTPMSPVKKVMNGIQKKGKSDKDGTTDSSTVSTPTADQDSLKKDNFTSEEIQELKAQDLADLEEEQEAIKEIEAVFRKSEGHSTKDENVRKIKSIYIDEDKSEKEEYLIIEREDFVEEKESKENEVQKLMKDSVESEKQGKLLAEEVMETQQNIKDERSTAKAKENIGTINKDTVIISQEEKTDLPSSDRKSDKEMEAKDVGESHPDEKMSANIKSGDTTTAPTLPEDERITLDEIKEDNGYPIEEKYAKEETKEKGLPVIQLPPKTFESVTKTPGIVGIRLDKQSHIRDVVKTPDEVADLPMHEEVDYEYAHELKTEIKSNDAIQETSKSDNDNQSNIREDKSHETGIKAITGQQHVDKYEQKKETNEEYLHETQEKTESIKMVNDGQFPVNEIYEKADKEIMETKLPIKKEEETTQTEKKSVEESKNLDVDKYEEQKIIKDEEQTRKDSRGFIDDTESKTKIVNQILKTEEKVKENVEEVKEEITQNIEKPGEIHKETHEIMSIKCENTDEVKEMATVLKDEDSDEKLKATENQAIDLQQFTETDTDQSNTTNVKILEMSPKKHDTPHAENIADDLDKPLKSEQVQLTKEKTDCYEETENKNLQAVKEMHSDTFEDEDSTKIKNEDETELSADALDLGKKSPKDREEDVIKIVATVAEVLKSDAPLEEFEGKVPIIFDSCNTAYVTELRETHITTMAPSNDTEDTKRGTILPVPEEPLNSESENIEKPEKEPSEIKITTFTIISDDTIEVSEKNIEDTEEQGTVQRMLVTASSEDGGEEIEICPIGTIVFSKSSESSGRSSPEKSQESKKSSIVDTISESVTTVKQFAESRLDQDTDTSDVYTERGYTKPEAYIIKDKITVTNLEEENLKSQDDIEESTTIKKDHGFTEIKESIHKINEDDLGRESKSNLDEIKLDNKKKDDKPNVDKSVDETESALDNKKSKVEADLDKSVGKFEEIVNYDKSGDREHTDRTSEYIVEAVGETGNEGKGVDKTVTEITEIDVAKKHDEKTIVHKPVDEVETTVTKEKQGDSADVDKSFEKILKIDGDNENEVEGDESIHGIKKTIVEEKADKVDKPAERVEKVVKDQSAEDKIVVDVIEKVDKSVDEVKKVAEDKSADDKTVVDIIEKVVEDKSAEEKTVVDVIEKVDKSVDRVEKSVEDKSAEDKTVVDVIEKVVGDKSAEEKTVDVIEKVHKSVDRVEKVVEDKSSEDKTVVDVIEKVDKLVDKVEKVVEDKSAEDKTVVGITEKVDKSVDRVEKVVEDKSAEDKTVVDVIEKVDKSVVEVKKAVEDKSAEDKSILDVIEKVDKSVDRVEKVVEDKSAGDKTDVDVIEKVDKSVDRVEKLVEDKSAEDKTILDVIEKVDKSVDRVENVVEDKSAEGKTDVDVIEKVDKSVDKVEKVVEDRSAEDKIVVDVIEKVDKSVDEVKKVVDDKSAEDKTVDNVIEKVDKSVNEVKKVVEDKTILDIIEKVDKSADRVDKAVEDKSAEGKTDVDVIEKVNKSMDKVEKAVEGKSAEDKTGVDVIEKVVAISNYENIADVDKLVDKFEETMTREKGGTTDMKILDSKKTEEKITIIVASEDIVDKDISEDKGAKDRTVTGKSVDFQKDEDKSVDALDNEIKKIIITDDNKGKTDKSVEKLIKDQNAEERIIKSIDDDIVTIRKNDDTEDTSEVNGSMKNAEKIEEGLKTDTKDINVLDNEIKKIMTTKEIEGKPDTDKSADKVEKVINEKKSVEEKINLDKLDNDIDEIVTTKRNEDIKDVYKSIEKIENIVDKEKNGNKDLDTEMKIIMATEGDAAKPHIDRLSEKAEKIVMNTNENIADKSVEEVQTTIHKMSEHKHEDTSELDNEIRKTVGTKSNKEKEDVVHSVDGFEELVENQSTEDKLVDIKKIAIIKRDDNAYDDEPVEKTKETVKDVLSTSVISSEKVIESSSKTKVDDTEIQNKFEQNQLIKESPFSTSSTDSSPIDSIGNKIFDKCITESTVGKSKNIDGNVHDDKTEGTSPNKEFATDLGTQYAKEKIVKKDNEISEAKLIDEVNNTAAKLELVNQRNEYKNYSFTDACLTDSETTFMKKTDANKDEAEERDVDIRNKKLESTISEKHDMPTEYLENEENLYKKTVDDIKSEYGSIDDSIKQFNKLESKREKEKCATTTSMSKSVVHEFGKDESFKDIPQFPISSQEVKSIQVQDQQKLPQSDTVSDEHQNVTKTVNKETDLKSSPQITKSSEFQSEKECEISEKPQNIERESKTGLSEISKADISKDFCEDSVEKDSIENNVSYKDKSVTDTFSPHTDLVTTDISSTDIKIADIKETYEIIKSDIDKESIASKSEKECKEVPVSMTTTSANVCSSPESKDIVQDKMDHTSDLVTTSTALIEPVTETELYIKDKTGTTEIHNIDFEIPDENNQVDGDEYTSSRDEKPKDLDIMCQSFYGTLPDNENINQSQLSPSYLFEVTNAKYTLPSSSTTDITYSNEQKKLKSETITDGSSSTHVAGEVVGHGEKITEVICDNSEDFEGNRSRTQLYEATTAKNLMLNKCVGENAKSEDAIIKWGKPLGLPSPAPVSDNKGTPKKERKLTLNVNVKNKWNEDKKRSDSPSKAKNKKMSPVYVDLTYVPHHGNAHYSYVDFFKVVRARYYVFSGIEPGREVYNALLEAKQTWENKELEVTIIPTYDTDVLGYWVAENEELLTKCKIDLSPSASRCTINLQDHETSCSAYRLEF